MAKVFWTPEEIGKMKSKWNVVSDAPKERAAAQAALQKSHVHELWSERGFLSEGEILQAFPFLEGGSDSEFRKYFRAFNGSDLAKKKALELSSSGDQSAEKVVSLQQADPAISSPPYSKLAGEEFHRLRALIKEDPSVVHSGTALEAYPYYIPGRTYGYDIAWVREMLGISAQRLEEMKAARTRDVAVLVGNGPSLNKTDLSLLEG